MAESRWNLLGVARVLTLTACCLAASPGKAQSPERRTDPAEMARMLGIEASSKIGVISHLFFLKLMAVECGLDTEEAQVLDFLGFGLGVDLQMEPADMEAAEREARARQVLAFKNPKAEACQAAQRALEKQFQAIREFGNHPDKK